jgi:transposase
MKQIQELLKERKQRGYEIAKASHITEKNGVWHVPSASGLNKTYQVILTLEGGKCTCKDYEERGLRCKHYFAVQYTLTKTQNRDGTTTITQTKRITYPQNWKAYDLATEQQKEMFQKLLNDLCLTIPEKPYTFGRPSLPMRDMVFASALKVYSTFSLRRFGTDKKEALAKGYLTHAPDYTTIAKYMEDPDMTPILKDILQISALPLKAVENDSFSIDSSGFSPHKFSRWSDYKYGANGKEIERRLFYKAHIVVGNKTQIICNAEITSQFVADPVMLPQLVAEVKRNFDVRELDADKAYSGRPNFDQLERLGIVPMIPFKENATPKPRGHSHIWRDMYNYFTYNREAFLMRYHQRSNVESAFFMVKSKFSDHVRSKTETACINEILLKLICHNLCVVIQETFELGIQANFMKGEVVDKVI